MPTYQYACTDAECGNRFELVQSFTDPAATECPVCHNGVRKVYGSVGVVFKGSGFYRTDSRAAAKSSSDGASSESGGKTKSDKSKSEAKSESASGSTSATKSDAKAGASSTSSASSSAAAG